MQRHAATYMHTDIHTWIHSSILIMHARMHTCTVSASLQDLFIRTSVSAYISGTSAHTRSTMNKGIKATHQDQPSNNRALERIPRLVELSCCLLVFESHSIGAVNGSNWIQTGSSAAVLPARVQMVTWSPLRCILALSSRRSQLEFHCRRTMTRAS